MVYDNTAETLPDYTSGERGFNIQDNGHGGEHRYTLYTDDGRGNGDEIASSNDLYWIRRIAHSLDFLNTDEFAFDHEGNPS